MIFQISGPINTSDNPEVSRFLARVGYPNTERRIVLEENTVELINYLRRQGATIGERELEIIPRNSQFYRDAIGRALSNYTDPQIRRTIEMNPPVIVIISRNQIDRISRHPPGTVGGLYIEGTNLCLITREERDNPQSAQVTSIHEIGHYAEDMAYGNQRMVIQRNRHDTLVTKPNWFLEGLNDFATVRQDRSGVGYPYGVMTMCIISSIVGEEELLRIRETGDARTVQRRLNEAGLRVGETNIFEQLLGERLTEERAYVLIRNVFVRNGIVSKEELERNPIFSAALREANDYHEIRRDSNYILTRTSRNTIRERIVADTEQLRLEAQREQISIPSSILRQMPQRAIELVQRHNIDIKEAAFMALATLRPEIALRFHGFDILNMSNEQGAQFLRLTGNGRTLNITQGIEAYAQAREYLEYPILRQTFLRYIEDRIGQLRGAGVSPENVSILYLRDRIEGYEYERTTFEEELELIRTGRKDGREINRSEMMMAFHQLDRRLTEAYRTYKYGRHIYTIDRGNGLTNLYSGRFYEDVAIPTRLIGLRNTREVIEAGAIRAHYDDQGRSFIIENTQTHMSLALLVNSEGRIQYINGFRPNATGSAEELNLEQVSRIIRETISSGIIDRSFFIDNFQGPEFREILAQINVR